MNTSSAVNSEQFWDKTLSDFTPFKIDPVVLKEKGAAMDQKLFEIIGGIKGKEVLDIGCGNGVLATYMAQMGAKVTAIDISTTAVNNTSAMFQYNNLTDSAHALKADAMKIEKFGNKYDLLVGRGILHHIEPFDKFSEILLRIAKPGCRGVFLENNAKSPMLMFFRNHVIGRFGIPKLGDNEEVPLQVKELDILRQKFEVIPHYPQFLYLSLLNAYVFSHNQKVQNFLNYLDAWIYRNIPSFHKYSYVQIVELKRID